MQNEWNPSPISNMKNQHQHLKSKYPNNANNPLKTYIFQKEEKKKLTRIGVSPTMSVENDAADWQRNDLLIEKAAAMDPPQC